MVKNLSITKIIKCNFSADQWELFTHSFDKDEIDLIAIDLNRLLEHTVNIGSGKDKVYEHMHKLMSKYSKYGAYDSEPLRFLERVLREVYDN